ncbi:MAG: nitroreductase [Roseateles depolymerans]|uniref:Putative NAD(P)H nitroreductase n=1 Tax=Roseateles depolymerans TaxID=76731 RepID=A0A2W5D5P9_9BURK|nr:MAG: nitroreductase [Roseateles depolymerans]
MSSSAVPALLSASSPPLSEDRRAELDSLLSRYSPWPLDAPAPNSAELDLVLDAALRAPDHGALRPWRYAVIAGDARSALGEVFVDAARLRGEAADAERFRAKAMAAPLIIAMAAHVRTGHKVPELEQLMSGAAAAMNMLNALHLLGYGGFWATGVHSRDPHIRRALGFGVQDHVLGFLYVGTARPGASAPARPLV